jgi:hypothetical protein
MKRVSSISNPTTPIKKSQIGTFNDEIKSREEENFAGKYNGDRGAQPLFGSQSLAA